MPAGAARQPRPGKRATSHLYWVDGGGLSHPRDDCEGQPGARWDRPPLSQRGQPFGRKRGAGVWDVMHACDSAPDCAKRRGAGVVGLPRERELESRVAARSCRDSSVACRSCAVWCYAMPCSGVRGRCRLVVE